MNFSFQSDSLYDVVKCVFLCTKLVGFAPFSVVGDVKNGVIQSTMIDVAWCSAVFSSLLYILYANLMENILLQQTNSIVVEKGGRVILLIAIINLMFIAFSTFVNRHRVWKILGKIHRCDSQVSE
jgi:7tm Chemosensory receptor